MPGGLLGGASDLLFGSQPDVPDFMGIAKQQLQANRPNQNTPYGQRQWVQDANGNWTQNTSFSPEMQGANDSLMTQWGQNAANGYGTGDDARNQSIDASWGQFQRMNDPLFAQQQTRAKSDLLNSGADMGDSIYGQQMGNLNDQQDRMRLNAQDQAIAAGDRAQGQTFSQNRQAWMDPLTAMQGMNSLLTMPGVPQTNDLMQGAQAQFGAETGQYQQGMQNITGLLNGAGSVAGAVGGIPSPFSFGGGGGGGNGGGFAYGGNPYSPGQLQGPNWG